VSSPRANGADALGHFGNSEEGKLPPLEIVTIRLLMGATEGTSVLIVMNQRFQ
jgi:hypothetical protein